MLCMGKTELTCEKDTDDKKVYEYVENLKRNASRLIAGNLGLQILAATLQCACLEQDVHEDFSFGTGNGFDGLDRCVAVHGYGQRN